MDRKSKMTDNTPFKEDSISFGYINVEENANMLSSLAQPNAFFAFSFFEKKSLRISTGILSNDFMIVLAEVTPEICIAIDIILSIPSFPKFPYFNPIESFDSLSFCYKKAMSFKIKYIIIRVCDSIT